MKKFRVPYWVLYAIPVFAILAVVLLAYWPGILVSDSMYQWHQAQTANFDDWHPAYNTIYIFLLTKICNSPAFVLLVQILIMSLAIGYFFSIIEKYYKVNKIFLLISATIFAIIPLNYNFAVTLLKDTLYSTFIIVLTGIVIDIINDEEFFKNKFKCIFLFIICLAISLFRHNGIIVVGLLGVVICFIYRKYKFSYLVFGGWIITYLLMTTVGFKILKVNKNSYANTYGPVSHIIARMLNTDGIEFTPDEIEFISKYADVDKLKETFNPYNMDYSINSQNIDELKNSGNEYLKFGISKAIEHPYITCIHYLDLTSFLYSPKPFEGAAVCGMFTETDLWVYNKQYPNLNENSKLPKLLTYLKRAVDEYQKPELEDYTMRPALYMYLSICMIIVIAEIKKNRKMYLILLPTLFNTISLIPAIPVAMTRYVYATMFGFYCILIWFIYEMYALAKRRRM